MNIARQTKYVIEIKSKGPTQASSGHLGANAKARKRRYEGTGIADEGKQRPKKEKVDKETEKFDIPTMSMVPYDSTEIVDEAGTKFSRGTWRRQQVLSFLYHHV